MSPELWLDGRTVSVVAPDVPALRMDLPTGAATVVLPVGGPPGPEGPEGPEGPQGPPGGTSYVHTQSAPAASWVIDHNLGRRVHVSLLDPAGRLRFADVEHGSLNQTSITYPSPVTGFAVIS